MKVLFIARSTLYTAPGGDTIQIESTAKYLRLLGVGIDIKLSNQKISYDGYDLLHFFNIIRPSDILSHVKNSGKPYVISTIFVDYSEYDRKNRGKLLGKVTQLFSASNIEYIKAIIRLVKNRESINSKDYFLKGHRKSIIFLLKNASYLLPNSESEYLRLQKEYNIVKRYKVIPNAIDLMKFEPKSVENNSQRDGIICVARVEGLKNQLNLIRAFKNTPHKVLIIGKPGPNNHNYYRNCIKEATSNITFIDHISQEELAEFYRNAKVHVLPSWFETTGLSSLEAAYMGCNIVITDKGDTREYFKNYAYYCNPNEISSIYESVMEAYQAPYNEQFRDYIKAGMRWEIAAEKTLEAYKEVVN